MKFSAILKFFFSVIRIHLPKFLLFCVLQPQTPLSMWTGQYTHVVLISILHKENSQNSQIQIPSVVSRTKKNVNQANFCILMSCRCLLIPDRQREKSIVITNPHFLSSGCMYNSLYVDLLQLKICSTCIIRVTMTHKHIFLYV